MSRELSEFTREALMRGAARSEIAAALKTAGWTDTEVRGVLDGFAEIPFPLPVPKPKPRLHARETFLYLVMFAALFLSAWALTLLVFQLIDRAFPDPLLPRTIEVSNDLIRWYLALLIVAFPLFLFNFWTTTQAIVRDPDKRKSGPRRWLTYLTLFAAVSFAAGALVGLLYRVLGGTLTVPFLLKSATVAVIAAGTLGYFLPEARKDEA